MGASTIKNIMPEKFSRFQDKTLDVIYNLKFILNERTQIRYNTYGEFLREIEMLKFPYTKDWKRHTTCKRNFYTGQQYETIVSYCVSQGWIEIKPANNKSYHVYVAKNIKSLGFSEKTDYDNSKNIHVEKPVFEESDSLGNVNYTNELLAKSKPAAIKKGSLTELSVNIMLDPDKQWYIKTVGNKSYLSTK